jgi:protein-S-isoprenylcysteine O-methyltransferase Ste14
MGSNDMQAASPRSKQGGPNVRFPPPLVFLGFLLAGVILQRALPFRANVGWVARAVAGGVLAGGGLGLLVWANSGFRRIGRTPEPWIPSSSLILEGPYKFSRNPMYLAMTAAQMGIGAALDNGWVVLFTAPAFLVVHLIAVRPEERYLEETFGEGYAALKKRVRRYL